MEKNIEDNIELIKFGRNFLGILNDIKRRPADAARELGVSLDEIQLIIDGKKKMSHELIERAIDVWPVNARDFFIIHDDCPLGIKMMSSEESEKSSRIMDRAGKPYYEYRDTAMSTNAPFRPEWIMELCHIDNNDPNNPNAQWNNGHFMHQFTYFIGEVNFYYKIPNGERKVAVMNTGDSMYITPFVAHTFTTRKGSKQNGLILALTYGSKLTGDIQQELSSLSTELGSNFALDFSSKENAISSLLNYHRISASISVDELSKRADIPSQKLIDFEEGKQIPTNEEFSKLALGLKINVRDLLPNDKIEEKVIVKHHYEGKKWYFPSTTKVYEFLELASTTALPSSKAYEVNINNNDDTTLDLSIGLHQYVYNIGDTNILINWNFENKNYQEIIHPGDSLYVKPFLNHNFRGEGKILILRIGGKIVGDSQRELSFIGKDSAKRAISETIQWFDPKGKN